MTIERNNGNQPANSAMQDAMAKAGLRAGEGQQPQSQASDQRRQSNPSQQSSNTPSQPGANMSQDFSENRRTDNRPTSLADNGRAQRRPIARNSSSHRVRQLEKAIGDELGVSVRDGVANNWAVLLLDVAQTQLALPVIMVLMVESANATTHVSAFSILVNSEEIRLSPRMEKGENGRPIELRTVAGDVYNSKEYWARVQQLIGEQYQNASNLQIHDAGGLVIPESFDTQNGDVHGLVYTAGNAAYTVMNTYVSLDDAPPINVANRKSNEILTARLAFSGEQRYNVVNEPIRSDVVIELDSSTQGVQDTFLQPTSMLTKTVGFITPVFAQAPSQINTNGPRNDQPYWANFVITDIESGFDAFDLELVLLALNNAALLANRYAFADAFRPRFSQRDGNDLRDIGALGYTMIVDGKPLGYIDTKTEGFQQEFAQLILDNFRDGLLTSIDVPEIGEKAWALDIFRAAANGDLRAVGRIRRAADNLTNGAFSQIFGDDTRIAADDDNRIHLGYWTDEQGRQRDLRSIDYLAVLNIFGKTAPGQAVAFADTYSPKMGTLAARLDARLQIIDSCTSGNWKLTGYANRLNFYGPFIQALLSACDRAGLVVNPANVSAGLGATTVLGGYDVGQYAVSGGVQGVFQNRGNNYDANRGNYNTQQNQRRFGDR